MRTRQPCLVLAALIVATADESRASEPASAMDTRGRLGVENLNVAPQAARALRLEQPQGVMVLEITPSSVAAHASLERADVIPSFNGEAIDEPGELPRLIAQQENGAEVMHRATSLLASIRRELLASRSSTQRLKHTALEALSHCACGVVSPCSMSL